MKKSDLLQSGRDYYNGLYEQDVAEEARWLDYGASCKVDSIEQLLARQAMSPHSILEIGCGTGSILRQLESRRIGRELFGVDFSESAIRYAQTASPRINYFSGDVTSPHLVLPRDHFDLVVISHVLEHLENPEAFLRKIQRLSFSALLAEVPLEDLPASRLKALVRDRRKNPAGHVQFFTATSFRALLRSAGYSIASFRRYSPVSSLETVRFAARRNGLSRLHAKITEASAHYLPKYVPLWSRFYYAHYAALCLAPLNQPSPRQ